MRRSKIDIISVIVLVLAVIMCCPAVSAQGGTMERLTGSTPKKYYIKDVKVEGVQLLDDRILASSAGINLGDSILLPSPFIASSIARLWGQRRFADVKLEAEIEGDNVTMVIVVKEQPRVLNWAIEGPKRGQVTELLDKMKLRRNTELSEYVIDRNVGLIKEFFAEKGYRNTEVELKVVDDTINTDMINATFVVDLKGKVHIDEIIFEGNEQIEAKKLRSAMKKTKERNIINIFKGSKLKDKEYAEDKESVIDYYNSKGFRNAMLVSDSIYKIDDKKIGIKIKVEEGNKYYIRNVEWVGNSVYTTEQLDKLFGVRSGDTYDKRTMYKRLGIGNEANPDDISVLTLYQNEGYLMSQVDPAEVIVGRDSIDMELKVFEGKPFTINEVSISGNLRVDDKVIRREVYTRPGELYNRSLLMQTIRTLGSMGHFNAEAIMPDIRPVTNELVNIGWVLEEQASDQFNVSGGWGSGSFIGSVGITLNNISIKNFFKKGAWKPYPMGQNQKLSVQAQTNGTYYKAFSMTFSEPWLGGRKPNSLSISAHYSDQNDAYYAWESSTTHYRTLGLAAGIGKRLTWPDPYFTLYTEFSYERYMLKDWDYFIMENGDANLLSAKVVFARNSIDQQIYPRRGSEFSASLQFTPPYSLFNGKDYSDEDMADEVRYKFIEFHKWNLKATWYQSFLSNSNLVLKLHAEMGYLGHYDKNLISPFERFEVGGDGLSGYSTYGVDLIALRGYEEGALDPVDSDYSLVYNKYTVELRYPVMLQPSSQIYVLAFMEAGNGFASWRDFNPFNVKRSAGVGLRLYLPIVGMLGIDWGYGFDPASGESEKSGSQFHFSIGQTF